MAFSDLQTGSTIRHGETPGEIVLAGTVTKGDALGFSSGWQRALATTGGVIQIRCVASEDGVTGQTIVAYFGDTVVGGARFTGATAGGAIYVAEGTSVGKYTQTAPDTAGDSTKIVGYAVTATELLITPQANADTVHA